VTLLYPTFVHGSCPLEIGPLPGDYDKEYQNTCKTKVCRILRTIGSGVGHGQNSGTGVRKCKVLVCELGSVDGFSTCSVVVGEITSLAHESGDDTVETGSLESESLFSGTQSTLGHERYSKCEQSFHVHQPILLRKRAIRGRSRVVITCAEQISDTLTKFSAVLGTTSALNSMTIRPAAFPPMVISKNTWGLDLNEEVRERNPKGVENG